MSVHRLNLPVRLTLHLRGVMVGGRASARLIFRESEFAILDLNSLLYKYKMDAGQ
jgi:hypothetical protein